jgi:hypothetical protein
MTVLLTTQLKYRTSVGVAVTNEYAVIEVLVLSSNRWSFKEITDVNKGKVAPVLTYLSTKT